MKYNEKDVVITYLSNDLLHKYKSYIYEASVDIDKKYADYYIYNPEQNMEVLSNSYRLLHDAKNDIFSELPKKVFLESYNEQMSNIMNNLYRYYNYTDAEIGGSLPKFQIFTSEDKAEIIQFINNDSDKNINVYFSFEENHEYSSYGVVFNDIKHKEFYSKSGLLCNQNMEKLVEEIFNIIVTSVKE